MFLLIEISLDEIKLAISKLNGKINYFEKINIIEDTYIEKIILDYIYRYKIKTKDVILVLKEDKVIKRIESFNGLSLSKIDKLIKNNIREYFPVDSENFVVDYRVVSRSKMETKIMLASIQKNIIQKYLDIFQKINLNCIVVDFYQNAISNVFSKIFDEKTLLINLIDEKASFTLLDKREIVNIREINLTTQNEIVREVNKSFGYYSNQIFEIKNLVFIDEILEVKNAFSSYNMKNFSDIKSLTGLNKDELSFFGVTKLLRYLK